MGGRLLSRTGTLKREPGSAAFVGIDGPTDHNPIPSLGAPWLQLVNGATDGLTSTLHITANAGFAGPYLIGVNAAPATNISQITSNVGAAGNKSFNAHLTVGDDANSVGYVGTADAGTHGRLIDLNGQGDGEMVRVYYSALTAGANQVMQHWMSAVVAGQDVMKSYADTGAVHFFKTLQANGGPFIVSAADVNLNGNTDRTRVSSDFIGLHRYAGAGTGAAAQFYSGRVAGSDTTAAAVIVSVSSAAATVGGETWLEAFRAQRISGVAAGLGFYGAAAAIKQTVTGSRGGNAALASLLTALSTIGLVTDSSTA